MKTNEIPKVDLKDGDTFFVGMSENGFEKGVIIHNDGTKTDVPKKCGYCGSDKECEGSYPEGCFYNA
jgi:hypothetical protein